MIPGSDNIYKCPSCGNLFRQGSLMSGNTFGAKLFSDGISIAKMSLNFPNFTKCKDCGSFLNLRELKEVGVARFNYYSKTGYDSIEWGNMYLKIKYLKLNREDIPDSKLLEVRDLYDALEMFPQYELYFRLQILWSSNDHLRFLLEHDFPIRELDANSDKRFEENCIALLNLLDQNDENQKILMAELHRNLGQFDKCIELIMSIDRHSNYIKKYFILECERRNKLIFRIDNKKPSNGRDG